MSKLPPRPGAVSRRTLALGSGPVSSEPFYAIAAAMQSESSRTRSSALGPKSASLANCMEGFEQHARALDCIEEALACWSKELAIRDGDCGEAQGRPYDRSAEGWIKI